MQDVNPSVTRLEMHRLVGVILSHRLPEHIPKRDAETLRQRAKGLGNFTNDGGHSRSLANAPVASKFAIVYRAV